MWHIRCGLTDALAEENLGAKSGEKRQSDSVFCSKHFLPRHFLMT